MTFAKVAVTIDRGLLIELDGWVAAGEFPNRSRAVQAAIHRLKEDRQVKVNLLRELARLDPADERMLAEELFEAEEEWPKY